MIDDRFDRLASLFLGDHEPTTTDGMEALVSRSSPPPGQGHPPTGGSGSDGGDDFGGSGSDDGDHSRNPDRVAVITPLVAGNLPVLAFPWLLHVAARLDARPTALLRLASDGVQVALLNAPGPAESDRSDLAAWLLEAATVARRWFVVPRSGGEIETVSALEAEEAVVVTGGDEAATVAAYQWVRRLVESARSKGRASMLTPIAVVGCDEAAARQVASSVSTASQSFLGQPVPLAGVFPRLERTPVMQQRFYGEAVQAGELLAAIRTAGAAAWARGAAPSAARPSRVTEPASVPTPEATPSVAASPMPLVATGLPETLASCVPGLWPVSIRCPGHPQVEFATDEGGRLHLLATLEHAGVLRPAAAWAQRHAAVLRAGFPGLAADPLPLVERLVFTDATRAIEWHHAGLRLDLLVRSAGGWMHVPLNDERSMQP